MFTKVISRGRIGTLSSAVGLAATLAIPAGCHAVRLQALAQNVYYTDDGTTPTTSIGFLLTAGAAPTDYVGDLSKLKFIEASSGGKLEFAYYKQ